MYGKILSSKTLSVKAKIKNLVAYYMRRRGARILWNIYWAKVRRLVPLYGEPVDSKAEEEHIRYWKAFRRRVNPATMRIGYHISGSLCLKCIPEEVFQSDIELSLNSTASVMYISNKSLYNKWFGGNVFPVDYIHNIDGDWLDHELRSITFERVREIAAGLTYPVVVKPNRDSFGGSNVYFPHSSEELVELIRGRSNYLVQEKLTQHPFFQKFNAHGINSMRVNIYRSVKDNQLHVINMAFRVGVGGSLDNLTSGGIGVMVRPDGRMDGYALNGKGKKFIKHPDTGESFDQQIPDIESLKAMALQVASKVLYARVICLDVCCDAEGKWRMIEVNINSTTLMFSQYHGLPFFGQFTDEVRDYCIQNHWALKGK